VDWVVLEDILTFYDDLEKFVQTLKAAP